MMHGNRPETLGPRIKMSYSDPNEHGTDGAAPTPFSAKPMAAREM